MEVVEFSVQRFCFLALKQVQNSPSLKFATLTKD